MKKIIASGKRKTAIARAVLTEGCGTITINKKTHNLLHGFDKLKIEEPIRIAKNVLGKINFNIDVEIKGGGEKSQIEAACVAISRAILKFTKSLKLKKEFLDYNRNLLVADVRRKEEYKPGDSKARKKRQSSKR